MSKSEDDKFIEELDGDLPEGAEENAFSGTEDGVLPDLDPEETRDWDVDRDGRMFDYATDEDGEPETVCPHSDEAEEVGDDAQED